MKKQTLRRLLSLVLCLIMCLSLLPASAFAESEIAEGPPEATLEAAEPEAPVEEPEEPAEPAEEPEAPAEEPEEPAEEPEEPAEEPAEPTEEPAEPTEEPAEPTEEPAEPTEEPAEPTEEPAEPTEEPAGPTEEPAEPVEESVDGEQAGEQVRDKAADYVYDPAGGNPQPVAGTISSGQSAVTLNVVINSSEEVVYYRITPSKTAVYTIYSTFSDNSDTFCYLYDSSWNLVDYNDQGGTHNNFSLQYKLTANTTYYFGICFYYDDTGSIPVRLEMQEIKTGWNKAGDYWYYFDENGDAVTGWKRINGVWYYFLYDGVMAADGGFQTDYDSSIDFWKIYFFRASGAWDNTEGWKQNSHGTKYYVGGNGQLVSGWKTLSGKKYYFSKYDGSMARGVTYVYEDDRSYFFRQDGTVGTSGWEKLSYTSKWTDGDGTVHTETYESWYYLDSSTGMPVKGWKKINGSWYYFDGSDGLMLSNGIFTIDGKKYLLTSSGALAGAGWQKQSYDVYDSDGVKHTQTFWYYTDKYGVVQTGWQQIDNKWYYFHPDYYYMYADGVFEIDGKQYFFTASGARAGAGWQKRTGTYTDYGGTTRTWTDWYYTNSSGVITTGWKKIGGSWYYFDTEFGNMYADSYYEIGGKTYFFNSSGAMQKGWIKRTYNYSDGGNEGTSTEWYYADSNGVLQTEWQTINGKKYYFDPNYFSMYSDGIRWLDKPYFFDASGALAGAGWQSRTYTYNGKEQKTWFYTNSDGSAVQGWKRISGTWYYFGPVMYADGLYMVEGEYEFFQASGAWVRTTGSTAWRRMDNGKMRYVEDGKYVKGWKKIGGEYYYFESNGDMKTGWIKSSGKWYYCDPYMYYGGYDYIAGAYYAFDNSGAMQTGWTKISYTYNGNTWSYWVYGESGGKLAMGWRTINGKQYYFDPVMYSAGAYEISGTYYVFDKNGVWTGESWSAF